MGLMVRPQTWLIAATVCAMAYVISFAVAERSVAAPAPESSPLTYQVVRDGAPVAVLRECVGLGTASKVVEFREGTSPGETLLVPGDVEQIRVTCLRDLSADRTLADWREQVITNIAAARSAVEVRVLDQTGAPIARWQLENAWPAEVTVGLGTETLSLVAEALTRVP